jgi:cytochrome c oxidase assembly protein subunit 15
MLAWTAHACQWRPRRRHGEAAADRRLLLLVSVQIALGGWTSANYAALACATDFPKCCSSGGRRTDFREGFVLWRGIGVDYEGGILDNPARIAIQLAHRLIRRAGSATC